MPKKVHELLAVEGQLKGQAEKTRKELQGTMSNKRVLFEEKRSTFQPLAEGEAARIEAQSDIQTSVASELRWIAGIWSKALDVSYQVAEANTSARADVKLDDGTVLLPNFPTTALLDLEHRAGELQDLIKTVPTLDPVKGFVPDPDRPAGVYKAREVRKVRTKKVFTPIVMVPATEHFPAQVKADLFEDVPVGTLVEQEWSALITPAQKADMLERVEELRRALKTARMRANDAEVDINVAVGAKVFGFVFDGKRA